MNNVKQKTKYACNKTLIGRMVECSAPNHSGYYCVFEIDENKKTALIQSPSDFKAHWIHVRYLK